MVRTLSKNVSSMGAQTFALVLLVRNPCLSETILAIKKREGFYQTLQQIYRASLDRCTIPYGAVPMLCKKDLIFWMEISQVAYYNHYNQ